MEAGNILVVSLLEYVLFEKVDYDYDEDIDVPEGFIKVGNIYDLIFETNDSSKEE